MDAKLVSRGAAWVSAYRQFFFHKTNFNARERPFEKIHNAWGSHLLRRSATVSLAAPDGTSATIVLSGPHFAFSG
jgi:hypothetical protein